MEQISLSAKVRLVSSAYILHSEFDKHLGRTLMYTRNNRGPNIVLCGIQYVTWQLLERTPLITHCCMQFSKYEDSKSWAFPSIPYKFNLDSKVE